MYEMDKMRRPPSEVGLKDLPWANQRGEKKKRVALQTILLHIRFFDMDSARTV